MCWLTAYLTEQWDKGAETAGREAAQVFYTDSGAIVGMFSEPLSDAVLSRLRGAAAMTAAAALDTGAPLISEILAAMDIPPAEPAQVFNYEKQVWETPGAVEPPKPEPCAIIPAADEYSTIAARLREIEAEKRAALERMSAD
jgi:hypothetical protein